MNISVIVLKIRNIYTESFKGSYSLIEFVYSPISTADIYSMYYVP